MRKKNEKNEKKRQRNSLVTASSVCNLGEREHWARKMLVGGGGQGDGLTVGVLHNPDTPWPRRRAWHSVPKNGAEQGEGQRIIESENHRITEYPGLEGLELDSSWTSSWTR